MMWFESEEEKREVPGTGLEPVRPRRGSEV